MSVRLKRELWTWDKKKKKEKSREHKINFLVQKKIYQRWGRRRKKKYLSEVRESTVIRRRRERKSFAKFFFRACNLEKLNEKWKQKLFFSSSLVVACLPSSSFTKKRKKLTEWIHFSVLALTRCRWSSNYKFCFFCRVASHVPQWISFSNRETDLKYPNFLA